MGYIITMFVFIIISISPQKGISAPVCVNDKLGSKGAANQDINISLEQARDPLMKAFLTESAPKKKATEGGICPTCQISTIADKLKSNLGKIVPLTVVTRKIKKECIEASLQREPGNEGYSCIGQTEKKFQNFGASTPCLNQKTVDFMQFAVNKAINCLSSGRTAIDSRFILKKFNNETAFNFWIAYSGGKGIGQLTSDPVKEIAGWYKGKKYIDGNAYYILDDLFESQNPSCAPFKEIIKSDLETPPPSPGSKKNYCEWLRPGDGLGRNLVYSLGYYVHVRDAIIKPAIEKYSKSLARNQDTVNYFTLVAYGPGGPEEAKALIRQLRLQNEPNPDQVRLKIISHSGYVKQTEEKMLELLDKMKPSSNFADLRGDTCVQ